jgi:hypothetical protein
VQTLSDIFGTSSDELARADARDPQTPQVRPYTTAVNSPGNQPPRAAAMALLDPKGSAIFWIAAAAVLGLVLVTGQVKIEAALSGRGGR